MVRALPSPYDEGRFPGLVEALLNAKNHLLLITIVQTQRFNNYNDELSANNIMSTGIHFQKDCNKNLFKLIVINNIHNMKTSDFRASRVQRRGRSCNGDPYARRGRAGGWLLGVLPAVRADQPRRDLQLPRA